LNFLNIAHISDSDVQEAIISRLLSTKCGGPDETATFFMKGSSETLAPLSPDIFNLSLLTAKFHLFRSGRQLRLF
jgi:hypothetical protein